MTLSGCFLSRVNVFSGGEFNANIKPTDTPYNFAFKEPTLRLSIADIYPNQDLRDEQLDEGTSTFSAYIQYPANHVICFNDNDTGLALPVKNNKGEETALKFVSGMYPFELHGLSKDSEGQVITDCYDIGRPKYVGAIAFFSYEQDMEFATFGADDETPLISNEIISKVTEGILGSHTISYDNKPRIKYWVGNRSSLYSGGSATAEVDFSNANLASLKINGEKISGKRAILDIYESYENDQGFVVQKKKQHKLEFTTKNGQTFGGYLKELQDNEYTAFMKIPCDIPAELFEAASKGTVSKFDVMSKSEQGSTRIAQIVFGLRH